MVEAIALSEEDQLIEEMIEMAQEAPEPGSQKPLQALRDADGLEGNDVPPPSIINVMKSAGYLYMWDTKLGDRRIVNRNMARQAARMKRPDGTRVFTFKDPHIPQPEYTYKCYLHADDPKREHYDELGLAVCRKSNMRNEHDRKKHMMTVHKVEWETIEEERKQAEIEIDRALQRAILEKMGPQEEAPLYVSKKDRAKK